MPRRGILFILIATLSFAIMNVLAKSLAGLHFSQIVFFRAFGTFIFVFPYMRHKRVSLIGNNPKLLLLRAVTGLLSLSTFFMAIQIIPLGSALSFRYVGPMFAAIMAYFFLKERVNALQWICFLVAFIGVIIVKGFDVRVNVLGMGLSLISAFFLGFVFVVIRYLATREHFLTIINYFMVLCIVASMFFLRDWIMPAGNEWYAIIFIGIFGLIGQLFMTKAFSLEEASVLAPFKYMEIVYALIMGLMFFGEGYGLLSYMGMLLIVGGMVLNVIFKSKANKLKPSLS